MFRFSKLPQLHFPVGLYFIECNFWHFHSVKHDLLVTYACKLDMHVRRELTKQLLITAVTEAIQMLQEGKFSSPGLSYIEMIHSTSSSFKI